LIFKDNNLHYFNAEEHKKEQNATPRALFPKKEKQKKTVSRKTEQI